MNNKNASLLIYKKEILIHISSPKENEIEKIVYELKNKSQDYKNEICNECLDFKNFLKDFENKISTAIKEIHLILEKKITDLKLVEYFSDKIKKVNLVKLNIKKLQKITKLQKDLNCNFHTNFTQHLESSQKTLDSLEYTIERTKVFLPRFISSVCR